MTDSSLRPRIVVAPNEGAFTLDGTRTYLVGRRRVAVVDPGPASDAHLEAVVEAVAAADEVVLLQTHGHSDHAGTAEDLARRLGTPVRGAGGSAEPMRRGDAVETDAGTLVAVPTPGHAEHHLAFHWPEADAVFVGDLLLGRGDTTWLGAYPGCVADFLDSLVRVEDLEPSVLYPGHGPPIRDVARAIERYRRHRRKRLQRLREVLRDDPEVSGAELLDRVYGDVPDELRDAAGRSLEVMIHHLRTEEDAGAGKEAANGSGRPGSAVRRQI